MKGKRTVAAITALALICGASPVMPFANVLDKAAITASAETNETVLDIDKLWSLIVDNGYSDIWFVGSSSVELYVTTTTSISNDNSIYAGLGDSNMSPHTLYIFAMDDGHRADKKVKAPKDCSYLFNPAYNFKSTTKDEKQRKEEEEIWKNKIKSIDCSGLDTSEVTNMEGMFANNYALTSLNISGFNTDNVSDMNFMFTNDRSLSELDLSNFNTEKVKNMSYMFDYCMGLTSLDISNFNTQNVTEMARMFYCCTKLPSLTFGENFNTSKVTNMSYMLGCLNSISTLDVSRFNTQNVTDMSNMFNGSACTSIKFGDSFDTGKVENMAGMFAQMNNLSSLDLSKFNTSNVTDMSQMFWMDDDLKSLDLSNFTVNDGANTTDFVKYCPALQSVTCTEEIFEKLGFDNKSVTRQACGMEKYIINGYSLDIKDGNYLLNVYMDFPANLDESTAFVLFTLPDGTNTKIFVKDGKLAYANNKAYLAFPVEVSAKDMYSKILVNVYKDKDTLLTGQGTISVEEYALALKKRDSSYSSFVGAMLNYGAYAKAYFNDEEYNPSEYKTTNYKQIADYISSNGKVDAKGYIGSSLLLKNKIILRHYFSVEVPDAVKKGDYWYVEQAFNLTELNKSIDNYGNYNIYDYIKKVLIGDYDAKLKNLCCALYYYNYFALELVK